MPTAAFLALLLLTSGASRSSDEAVLTLGRRLSADFWAGRLDPVWTQMSEKVHEGLGGSPAGLATARDQLVGIAGGPGETLAERVGEVQGMQVYLRTFQGKSVAEPWLEQWVIEEGGTVAGFFFRPTVLQLEGSPAEPTLPAPKYLLAACLLAGTALSMGALSLWLQRAKRT